METTMSRLTCEACSAFRTRPVIILAPTLILRPEAPGRALSAAAGRMLSGCTTRSLLLLLLLLILLLILVLILIFFLIFLLLLANAINVSSESRCSMKAFLSVGTCCQPW